MCEMMGHIEAAEPNEKFRTTGAARPVAWSMTATARPHKIPNFEAMLLAIPGHDLSPTTSGHSHPAPTIDRP
jgi:hypothetical protein